MLPGFLLPETTVQDAGNSSDLELGASQGRLVLLTLGITRIIEQESLDLSIWGSSDNSDWGSRPLATFPQKFYCGTYQVVLDLSDRHDVRYLRARWVVNRWGKGDATPLFDMYLFVKELEPEALAITA